MDFNIIVITINIVFVHYNIYKGMVENSEVGNENQNGNITNHPGSRVDVRSPIALCTIAFYY